MKHLVIGIDIDGVIVDFGNAVLPLLSEACSRPVPYQDIRSLDFGRALNIDKKTVAYIWKQILGSDLLRCAPPIKGAIEGLSALSEHEVWIITGRPTSLKNLTVSWLHENKVKYDCIVFDRRGDKFSAGPRFDVFVEDFMVEAYATAEAGVFTLLFDQPWNQDPILSKNCRRFYDWSTIVLYINQFQGARHSAI